MEFGRFGAWCGTIWRSPTFAAEAREGAAELEELGFSALWHPSGFDTSLDDVYGPFLDATSAIPVASGIASVWHHPVETAAPQVANLERAFPGRFLFTIGASHAQRVGESYTKPYSKVASYLDQLDALTPPIPAERRALAALGPRMLALAGERTFGAHPYFVPAEHSAFARSIFGPQPFLGPEVAVVVESDATTARQIARKYAANYLALPNYVNNLRNLGYGEEDFAGGGSDRLIDDVIPWGDPETLTTRLNEHLAAGADHVAVQILGTDEDPLTLGGFRRLAEALFD